MGQWLLGLIRGPGTCTVGKTPIQALLINFHGSSGAGAAGAPPAPECAAKGFDASPLGKAGAEVAVRDELKKCGVTINKSACAAGSSFKSTAGGCTDVGGLQCDTVLSLCDLAKKCGPFTITGGSEAGHTYHGGGNAVDVSSSNPTFNSCVEKFGSTPCPARYKGGSCFKDATGTVYWREPGGTAPHWHICRTGEC